MKNALLTLALLFLSIPPIAAQSAADGVDSTLLAYYQWCNRHKKDPEMLLKADTMFRLAGERQNIRMQSVALCLKTDYYYYTDNFDSLRVWITRTQEFTRRHKQFTHYYFAWMRLISYYTKYSKYTLAQYELEHYRDQADKDNYKSGVTEAYKQLGHIYRTQNLFDQAIDCYRKAIESAGENAEKQTDVSYLYVQLGEMYTQRKMYAEAEQALQAAEKTILLADDIWRVRFAQAILCVHLEQIPEAHRLLRDIRENGYIEESRLEEAELSIYKLTGDYTKALTIVNRQLALYDKSEEPNETHYFLLPSLNKRATINYRLGNYRAAADDLSRYIALQSEKSTADTRETLSEFATLLDVERLDREKAEAQRQIETERLRRARMLVVGLGLILLLAAVFIVILTRLNRHLAKAKRAAEESNRMKGVFIRTITHEINTPLNAICGFSELASTVPADDPERDSYLGIIRENSDYLQKLVDDVLYIADLESSDTPPAHEQTDINACCRDCIGQLSKGIPRGGAEIRFLPGNESCKGSTSRLLLTKAIAELLRNAVRFAGGQGPITLSYVQAENGRSITFAVEDKGPGIPAGERERIFERFVKLDAFGQGMGLGLSVCRLIAQALGGRIWLDESYTGGARFLLTIPIE